jgi:hypothetical protein
VLNSAKKVFPPLFVVTVALPAVLELAKTVFPPLFVVTVALPAVLDSAKSVYPSLYVVIFAVPAVLMPWNSVYPAVPFVMMEPPAVLAELNVVDPPSMFAMAAPPAALESKKTVLPPNMFAIVAFAAVLEPTKVRDPSFKKTGAYRDAFCMPAPNRVRSCPRSQNQYVGALTLRLISLRLVPAENNSNVLLDAPNVAVPVGTVPVDQFAAVLKLKLPGLRRQVASCPNACESSPERDDSAVVASNKATPRFLWCFIAMIFFQLSGAYSCVVARWAST